MEAPCVGPGVGDIICAVRKVTGMDQHRARCDPTKPMLFAAFLVNVAFRCARCTGPLAHLEREKAPMLYHAMNVAMRHHYRSGMHWADASQEAEGC